jgi:hypothetical protein
VGENTNAAGVSAPTAPITITTRTQASTWRPQRPGPLDPTGLAPILLGTEIDSVPPVPPIQSVATGIADLDRLLGGGLGTRAITVLAGAPGDGKSALALSIAMHVQRTRPVLYISTELEGHEIQARVIANLTGEPWRDIARRPIDRERFHAEEFPPYILVVGCDELPSTPAHLLESIRHTLLTRWDDLDDEQCRPLVIIDYLQDLARGTDDRSTRSVVGELATLLRVVAQATNAPILIVSSISRAYYGAAKQEQLRAAEDPRAYLAVAKESGDIDFAAAAVLYVDTDRYEPGQEYRDARIVVAKSRHGEVGFVGARFYGASGRWEASPESLTRMSGEGRSERRRTARDEVNERKLLNAIRKCPQAAWRHVRKMSTISPLTEADSARDRLVKAGRIVSRTEKYIDSIGRDCSRDVWRVVGDDPPADMLGEFTPPEPRPSRPDKVITKLIRSIPGGKS